MKENSEENSIRFYEIDLLRFLAALSVVFFHYTFQGHAVGLNPLTFDKISSYSKYAYLGVEFFFIISGYVVLMSAIEKNVRQFFISRIIRLYPAYWIACTFTFLAKLVWAATSHETETPKEFIVSIKQYIFNMTMLHNFFGIPSMDAPYWTLTIEIGFYFLISLLIGYRLLKHIDWILAGWLLYSLMPGITNSGVPFATLLFPQFAPYFIMGMLFYLLRQPQGRSRFRYALLLLSYVAALHAATLRAAKLTLFYHTYFSPIIVMLCITVFFFIFYYIAFYKSPLYNISWLSKLGALTYPLYLLHNDIGFIIFNKMQHSMNKYTLLIDTLSIMLLSAWLIHILIERPYTKILGTQLNKWLTKMDT